MPICIISAFYTLMRYAYQKKHKMIDEQSARDETLAASRFFFPWKALRLCRKANFELLKNQWQMDVVTRIFRLGIITITSFEHCMGEKVFFLGFDRKPQKFFFCEL